MVDTIIHWTKLENKKVPVGYGWYVTILKPVNYQEFERID